jgi:hypothetical protein
MPADMEVGVGVGPALVLWFIDLDWSVHAAPSGTDLPADSPAVAATTDAEAISAIRVATCRSGMAARIGVQSVAHIDVSASHHAGTVTFAWRNNL